MSWLLTKLSKPGFEKEFDNQEDAELHFLNNHCCDVCWEEYHDDGADPLETACGCEFMLEELSG